MTTTKAEATEQASYDVGSPADIPEGGRLVLDIDGVTVGIFRFKGELYAYENVCAHQGGPVCQGRLIHRVVEVIDEDKRTTGMRFDDEKLHIVCPWHGAEYDVTTGVHPAQPEFRLRRVTVTEDGGTVRVSL
jgi:nitrite reductase/ring-hydroxylating ferredoxin subunit